MTTADLASDDGVMGPRGDRPKRRVFTAEYKAAVVAEYEAAERGQRGQILRREGLHSSHVIEWRRARDAGANGPSVRFRRDDAGGWAGLEGYHHGERLQPVEVDGRVVALNIGTFIHTRTPYDIDADVPGGTDPDSRRPGRT